MMGALIQWPMALPMDFGLLFFRMGAAFCTATPYDFLDGQAR